MVHVDDVADGILLAYDKGQLGQAYVLGGEITTKGELIDKAAALGGQEAAQPEGSRRDDQDGNDPGRPLVGPVMGCPPNLAARRSPRQHVTYWAKDGQGPRRELGYSPATSTRGLRETIEQQH